MITISMNGKLLRMLAEWQKFHLQFQQSGAGKR